MPTLLRTLPSAVLRFSGFWLGALSVLHTISTTTAHLNDVQLGRPFVDFGLVETRSPIQRSIQTEAPFTPQHTR